MKVRTQYDGTDYITAGKEYKLLSYDSDVLDGYVGLGSIRGDDDEILIIALHIECAHLRDEGMWELVE